MCIAAIAWQLFDDMPLVLMSNRDEFLQRPTLPLHQWQSVINSSSIDQSCIIAGQDIQAKGTWLGINAQNGCWGVVLNYRNIIPEQPSFATSRGKIIVDYLLSNHSPLDFARQLPLMAYDGFNLVIGNRHQAVMLNNRGYGIEVLANGLYVLSNGQPDALWFKTEKLRGRVRQEILPLIAAKQAWHSAGFEILQDTEQAPSELLPSTGLPPHAEMALSSVFIPTQRMRSLFGQPYGTRVSSILTLQDNGFEMIERQVNSDKLIKISKAFN